MNAAIVTAQFRDKYLSERFAKPFNRSHIAFLISMGKGKSSVYESHHLEATVDLINKMQPKKVSVVIAGKLQRLSFWNSHLYSKWSKHSEEQLKVAIETSALTLTEEAIKRGEEWKTNNKAIINTITSCRPNFLAWDDIINLKNYQKYQNVIQKMYEQDETYKSILEIGAENYVSLHRSDIKNVAHRNLAKEYCAKYLLEESPLIIPPVLEADYILYHAEPNSAMNEAYKRLYPGQPLPWLSIHYGFADQKHFNTDKNEMLGKSSPFYSNRQEKRNRALVA